ncbi:MAG: Uma2 family endonuclease [Anaerolineales bacterium]|nr:Uma2 family endonuclease [Anaerolineales bacterium]
MTAVSATVETPATEQTRLKMTYDEYLAWAGEENFLAEWVNGEVIVHMPATQLHQAVKIFLVQFLNSFVRLFGLGRVLDAPFEMKLSPSGPAREPDVLFVATANLDRLGERRLNGPADLAIEIVSDDSVIRDREDKFFEYEAVGLPEYWIIDPRPQRRRAYFYQLDERGRYQPIALATGDVYHSRVLPGLWIKPEWLWQDPLPDPLMALTQVVGADKMIEFIRTGRTW